MDVLERASVIAFSIGIASLAAAAVGELFRRTAGIAGIRRIRMMARLAIAAVWSVLPPRWVVASVAAGLLAFAATFVAGVAITILIARAIPPEVRNPTEAYEGIGDAMMTVFRFYAGVVLSLFVASIAGLVAGDRVASQWGGGAPSKQAPPQTGGA